MIKKSSLYIILFVFLFGSCANEYTKVLKGSDPALKFEWAKKYYEAKKYSRAISLLEDVAAYYKGTELSSEVLYLIAKSYEGRKDFLSAEVYFSSYVKAFPRGKYAEECRFMIGYCHYKESPEARLDQSTTQNAIKHLQEFVELYPESERVNEAYALIMELNDKLAYKSFLNARLYYNMGNYMGNNYRSSIITAENTLKKYPDTKYREDLYMLILRSKYQIAMQSVEAKKAERFGNTIDEYLNYMSEFPNGKYVKEAQKIYKTAQTHVKN